jgi:hypothetical protein
MPQLVWRSACSNVEVLDRRVMTPPVPGTVSIRDLIHDARVLIDRLGYASLATVSECGDPWNASLHVALDEDWNLFWVSEHEAQHSLNLRRNPAAMLVVYDSTKPEQTAAGVYFKVRACELASALDVQRALTLLFRGGSQPVPPVDDFVLTAPRRVYQATPSAIWTNVPVDHGKHFSDRRIMLRAGSVNQYATVPPIAILSDRR